MGSACQAGDGDDVDGDGDHGGDHDSVEEGGHDGVDGDSYDDLGVEEGGDDGEDDGGNEDVATFMIQLLMLSLLLRSTSLCVARRVLGAPT